jgi:ketosteroid isomerase-like protein
MTSPQDNEATVRELIRAAYARDYDRAASLASPDIEVVDETNGQRYIGHEGLKQFVEYWLTNFRHHQQVITNLVADAEGVAIEYVFETWKGSEPNVSTDEDRMTTRFVPSRSAAFFQMTEGKVAGYHLYYNPPESYP